MTKFHYILMFLISFTSLSSSYALSQTDKRISGKVSDSFGPVIMANVVERDVNNRIISATVTDINGNFSMTIKNSKNRLVVSYIGYTTWSKVINQETTFNVLLQPDKTMLDEVTVKSKSVNSGGLIINKRELSAAQQTMDMEKIEGIAFTTADEALQGQIAGLDIVANSGNLGAGTTMRLRGVTTVNGNAEPLIVVDDKIFDNPDDTFDFTEATEESYASLLSINVEDIASITILKDAAATAIWGVNGANGVIEITTKRGSRGKPRLTYTYKFTGTWQPQGYHLLNGDDYTMIMKEELYNPAQASVSVEEFNYRQTWADVENWNNNTDWVDAVTQFGQQHSHVLSLSGGGEKANFRISGSYDHQTGTIIKQTLNRFSTRVALDFFVSRRIKFSTNFAFTYTDNDKNYTDLLYIAQKMAPNMSIYRQDGNGNNTDEYYIMNPVGDPTTGNYSSERLSSIKDLGNPVAIANLAWAKEKTYRITPDFQISYELLGVEEDRSRLSYVGRVDFDIYAKSSPTYYPAELETGSQKWIDDLSSYNKSSSAESNRLKYSVTNDLVFTPNFKNKDWSTTMKVRYQFTISKSNSESLSSSQLPTGLTSATLPSYLVSMSTSNSEARSQTMLYTGHLSYKSRYSLGLTVRGDGSSKFGSQNKWAFFPALSGRWNIIDESFMGWCRKFVSMLGVRGSWGVTGTAPSSEGLFYSMYDTSYGSYSSQTASHLDALKLDDLRWEKTKSYNIGINFGILDDRLELEFEYYDKTTTDLLMKNVTIPSTSGFSKLAYANVGELKNIGWELNVSSREIFKVGKFSMGADLNISQNYNEITSMNESVLESLNSTWSATTRGGDSYLNRVQVGSALGSIFGFRYLGVYQYTYDYLQNYAKEKGFSSQEYEDWINNEFLASGKTAPIALNKEGKVLMTSTGEPKPMVYNYDSGTQTYTFQGGDAMYEDINHDGQINSQDIVYLGSSLPKISGGFNLSFRYGRWSLRASFHYRYGNKVINLARMNLQKMYDTYNQCASVNHRWRMDGDVTPMPRAMYGTGYNWQGSSRYVEDGSYIRFNYLSLSYSVPSKMLKKVGLHELRFYLNMNNIYCFTHYSGTDPEHSAGAWGIATDDSQTPRSKSFTLGINIGL